MADILIDYTTSAGAWFYELANGTTGSLFSAAMLVTFFIITLCFAFRIPLEFGLILMLPLMIAFVIMTGQFMVILGTAIIYVSVILAQRFIF